MLDNDSLTNTMLFLDPTTIYRLRGICRQWLFVSRGCFELHPIIESMFGYTPVINKKKKQTRMKWFAKIMKTIPMIKTNDSWKKHEFVSNASSSLWSRKRYSWLEREYMCFHAKASWSKEKRARIRKVVCLLALLNSKLTDENTIIDHRSIVSIGTKNKHVDIPLLWIIAGIIDCREETDELLYRKNPSISIDTSDFTPFVNFRVQDRGRLLVDKEEITNVLMDNHICKNRKQFGQYRIEEWQCKKRHYSRSAPGPFEHTLANKMYLYVIEFGQDDLNWVVVKNKTCES